VTPAKWLPVVQQASWRTLRRAVAAFGLALPLTSALALDPARLLVQYHHQAFSPRGAAVTEVTEVAQTDDGYLWVGTSVGLYRFDGATFELISTLDGQSILHLPVVCLFAAPGGALWIGYGGGAGAGFYKNGKYSAIGPDKGWATMVSGAVDRDGVAWAVVDRRLFRVERLERHELGADWGVPNAAIHEVLVDRTGTVWVSTTGQQDLMYLPRGERQFRWVGEHIGSGLLAASHDGTIFVSGPHGLTAVLMHSGLAPKVVKISSRAFGRVLVDRDDGLFANTSSGLVHIGDFRRLLEPGGEQQLMGDTLKLVREVGPPSTTVWSITEDREGNVWVASDAALDRFRDSRFTPVPIPGSSFSYSVVRGDNGSVWTTNWDSGLLKVEGRRRISHAGDFGFNVTWLYRDTSGSIWVPTTGGLWHSDPQGKFVSVPVPEPLLQPWVNSMIVEASGGLWLSSANLVRRIPATGEWRELTESEGFGNRHSPRAMLADSVGRVWLASGSDIVRVEGDVPHLLPALSSRIHVGAIQVMFEQGRHLWFGGLDGLAVVHDDQVLNLKVRDGPPFNQVTGVVETPEGDLWIRSADDAWHVSAEELSHALRDNVEMVDVEHFDSLDGLASIDVKARSNIAQASDGVLWFSSRGGLSWIDPMRPRGLTPVPLRHIQSISIDGQKQTISDAVSLPPMTRHIEIAYTAIELGYPERIQFRYKLEGFDRDWQSASTRRVAYYNGLPPGDYRFHLLSTDRVGHWLDEDGAALAIHVAPAWFQTPWFRFGCLALLFVVASLLYRLRVKRVATILRTQLLRESAERVRLATARQDERDRIARELHDTLIQSTQGLIFIFQGLAEKIASDPPLLNRLQSALVRANEVAAEGRDMIEDLRLPVPIPVDLPGAFSAIGSEAGDGRSAQFRTIVTGGANPVQPGIGDVICRIGREAVINAFRHARAESIEVEILHGDKELIVSIRDDGIGLPAAAMESINIPGHWGIQGMRERATRLGARLELINRTSGGAEVRLTIPAAVAYAGRAKRPGWRPFRRKPALLDPRQ
jgi:signal transduction histidine kinase/ligand-binding sensor domain-containing protein